MRAKFITIICVLFTYFLSNAQEVKHQHNSSYSFVENSGQWEESVLFKSHFHGGNLWIEQHKMMFHLQDFSDLKDAHVNSNLKIAKEYSLPQTLVHLNFVGSNEVTEIKRFNPTQAYFNFFIGNDESKWASKVHGYSEAILENLYNGVDLKLIEDHEQLKYEFHVQPRNNPNSILLEYVGQESVLVNKKGELVIKTRLGEIIEQKPYAYQIVNGSIREVDCAFKIEENRVQFELGKYNPNVILVIDPVLIFATYSGSPTDNFGMTATYGNDGTAYSGGMIYGNAYPTPDPSAYNTTSNFTVQSNATYGITDAFVSKYSSDGSTMLWTTFIGGGDGLQGTETAQSMICDPSNNLYLYGATSSTDFPIVGGYQTTHAGGEDSLDFYQNGVHFKDQGTDIYVARISEDGTSLLASTYFGGTSNDGVNYKDNMTYYTYGTYAQFTEYDSLTVNYGDQFRGEIFLDKNGNCLVASCTKSTDFPVQSAFQPNNGGMQDGVLFQLNPSLSVMQWSSYYGGSNNDACYSVKVDSSNYILMAGGTTSSDLTNTAGGWQPTYNGGTADGFVSRITPDGTTLLQTSYIGTSDYDQTFFVEVDRANNVYMVGQSKGGNFPVINSGFVNPGSGQYIIKMDSTLTNVISSTVFGDGNPDFDISPSAFLVDICGNIYVSGWGTHLLQSNDSLANMPISSDAYQSTAPNGFDFYLMVLERDFSDILYGSYLGGDTAREHVDGGTSRFDKNGVVYQSVCGGCGGQSDFPTWPDPGVWSDTNLSTNCNNLVFKFDFELIPNAEFTIDNNMGCLPFTVNFDNFSTASDSYMWDFGNGDTSTVDFEPTVIFDSVGVFQVNLFVTDSICLLTDTAEIFITVFDSLVLSTDPDISICNPVPIDLIAYSNGSADQFIWSSSTAFTDTLNTDLSDSIFTITPPAEITYYVQISNAGCSRIDSISIAVTSSLLLLSANDSICFGESSTITASSQNPAITFNNFIWAPDSIQVAVSTSNSIDVNPMTSQYVYVTASSSTGCLVTDSILINVGVIDTSLVSATASEYTVPQGAEVTLYGEPSGYSYQWNPNSLVNQSTNQQTTATVDQTILYTLFVSDGICTKSDTVLITVYEFLCDDPYLYVPNAFTPNGDGENDVLYVRGPAIQEMVFRIYDRLGEMVFESFERPYGWDGIFRGKLMNPDVYDYYLKVTCIDQVETIIKGNFQLIR